MKEKKIVPKRRYHNFECEWKEYSFFEMVYRVSETSKSKNLPRVEFEDITSGLGVLNKDIHKKKSEKTGIIFKSGDILFGKLRPYLKNWLLADFQGIAVGDFWIFRPVELNSHLIYALIQGPKYQYVSNLSTGTKMPRSDWEIVSNTNFNLPQSIKEQQKIGNFFKHLDQMITLQQRKLEKTKAFKSAYLAEMFPAEGERLPKRRFAGFKDEWKEWKLGDLAEIVRGASPRPIQDPKWFDMNSNIGWLRISDVTEQNGRITYLKQRISILGQEKTRVLNEPHLLLSIAATVGKPVVNYVETGVHDGFLIFMNPKFDREFMFQWLEMFRPMWNKYGQPGSQVNLNSDIVKGQMIAIPSIEEQEMISEFFKKLDDTITNQQQKLNKLKAMKQAYLEEMFV